jgi:RecB family exonuclease
VIVAMQTGSQMDRVLRCEASAALPQVFDANPQDHRDRGTAAHAFLSRVGKVGRDAALAEVDEQWRPFCESIELAQLADRITLSTEVALSYNWRTDTARVLEVLDHRAYEVDPDAEIPLTIDLAGFADGTVYSGDYKGPHAWLPEPEQSVQLGLAALALARLHDAWSARVEYIRLRDDGTTRRFGATLDAFGLEAAADRIRTTMATVAELRGMIANGHVPNVTEGPWCRYCPARQHCPAKTALIRSVITDTARSIPYDYPITPENAGAAYALWRRARDAMSALEKALHVYARDTAIPVGEEPDGSMRFFGRLEREGREELDGAIAYQVIAERYGAEEAAKTVTMEVTKSAITDVVNRNLDKLQPGERKTHVATAIVTEIGKRGGSKRKAIDKPTEFTVAPGGDVKAKRRKAS